MSPTHQDLPAPGGCVACIGVFDGVHRGHQALLAQARERADIRGLPLVAVTFDPHPMSVVRPAAAPTSLATLHQRLELLRAAGADSVHVLHFDRAMAAMSPEDFVIEVLAGGLHVAEVVVGENFRFGHRAAGGIETLRTSSAVLAFDVTAASLAGEAGTRWSSTHARTLIRQGDVAGAAQVLGRGYSLDGTVVHGDHRGRELGFPTANLAWEGTPTLPGDGVYAGWLTAGADRLPAAISVGTNPQFNGAQRRVESYALDRDDLDLYGQPIEVEFTARIRGQLTFPDLEAFIARMDEDVEFARGVLNP
jgi:riboflavin kinase/FMN adenylyltransferase